MPARLAPWAIDADRSMKTTELSIETGRTRGLFDLTDACARFVAGEGDGRVLPRDDRWRHRHGSPGHGADHVVPAFAPPSIGVPVVAGQLALGTWQSIALVDTNVDNARRTVRLSFLAG